MKMKKKREELEKLYENNKTLKESDRAYEKEKNKKADKKLREVKRRTI